jgi:hypothetical protein
MALNLRELWLSRGRLERTKKVVAATDRKSCKTEPLLDKKDKIISNWKSIQARRQSSA